MSESTVTPRDMSNNVNPSVEAIRSTLDALFSTITCGTLVSGQKVIIISADTNVTEACSTLVKHAISSAPVYDSKADAFLGLIDYRDLVDYILIVCQNKGPDNGLVERDPTQALEWEKILSVAFAGKPVPVRMATDLSRRNPFVAVMPESALTVALDAMKEGIHRLCILNTSSEVIGILSQTDLARFIANQPSIMKALESVTIQDLNACHFPAIFAYGDELVHVALKRMQESGISSIAITHRNMNLIGNISMTDVKYIFKHAKMATLWHSCASFLSKSLSEEGIETGRDRYPFFDISLATSVAHALRKLLATKTHRIWVVDSNHMLTGVVALTDLLAALSPS